MERLQQLPVSVLRVDDEPVILQSLKHLSEGEGFSLLTASSGEEGLRILRSRDDVGVVIADQMMPSMHGVEFLESVWDAAPDTVRIMLTGHGDMSIASDAINKGGGVPLHNETVEEQRTPSVAAGCRSDIQACAGKPAAHLHNREPRRTNLTFSRSFWRRVPTPFSPSTLF
jgi:CheY-like chemotaxis protein